MTVEESYRALAAHVHAPTDHPADKVTLRRTTRANCPDCGPVDSDLMRCPYCLSECAPVVQQRPNPRIRAPHYVA